MWSKYCLFWSLRVLNEIDRSDTEEEVEETNIVTLGPEKRNTQQELIDVDRSYFVNEEGAASVSEDNFKTCSGGNGRREREKVQIKKIEQIQIMVPLRCYLFVKYIINGNACFKSFIRLKKLDLRRRPRNQLRVPTEPEQSQASQAK